MFILKEGRSALTLRGLCPEEFMSREGYISRGFCPRGLCLGFPEMSHYQNVFRKVKRYDFMI